jgi:hypothetical protein
MTAEEASELQPGDIVEHNAPNNYWIAKLVRFHGTHWTAVSSARGTFGTTLLARPENFTLVGHSDSDFSYTQKPI